MAIDWTKKTDKIDEISAEIFNKVFDSIQQEFNDIINGNTMVDRANTAQVAERADKADTDGEGNNIVDTYALKTEVGNIETALDNIIAEQEAIKAIQNALMGGGSV